MTNFDWIKVMMISFMMIIVVDAWGQTFSKKRFISYLPSINTRVNGIGMGLIMTSFKERPSSEHQSMLTTKVNGLALELIGAGLFLPLAPGDPMDIEATAPDKIDDSLDSLLQAFNQTRSYQINGISLSGSGTLNHGLEINGVHLSGAFSFVGRVNGLSIAGVINMNEYQNGVAISAVNKSLQTNGVQIGVYNKSQRMKGVQIGLFNDCPNLKGIQLGLMNRNGDRGLPFFNWSF